MRLSYICHLIPNTLLLGYNQNIAVSRAHLYRSLCQTPYLTHSHPPTHMILHKATQKHKKFVVLLKHLFRNPSTPISHHSLHFYAICYSTLDPQPQPPHGKATIFITNMLMNLYPHSHRYSKQSNGSSLKTSIINTGMRHSKMRPCSLAAPWLT